MLSQIKLLVSNGDLGQAIKKLLSVSFPPFYEEQIVSISSRYHRLNVNTIKDLISSEDVGIETAKINSSVMMFINQLIDAGLELETDSSSYDKKMSSEILLVAEQLYKEKAKTNKPTGAFKESGKDILRKIEHVIDDIINDMEESGVSFTNQGKIMAIAENVNNILEGKIEEGVIKNLSDSIYQAKNSRAMVLKDASKKQEAIFALQMTKGYLSALIETS